ncbi:hypothetical protein RFI_20531, partial [Reticulomyxa filosa]
MGSYCSVSLSLACLFSFWQKKKWTGVVVILRFELWDLTLKQLYEREKEEELKSDKRMSEGGQFFKIILKKTNNSRRNDDDEEVAIEELKKLQEVSTETQTATDVQTKKIVSEDTSKEKNEEKEKEKEKKTKEVLTEAGNEKKSEKKLADEPLTEFAAMNIVLHDHLDVDAKAAYLDYSQLVQTISQLNFLSLDNCVDLKSKLYIVAHALMHRQCQIRNLNIQSTQWPTEEWLQNNRDWNRKSMKYAWKVLGQALLYNQSLKVLNVSNLKLPAEYIQILVDALAKRWQQQTTTTSTAVVAASSDISFQTELKDQANEDNDKVCDFSLHILNLSGNCIWQSPSCLQGLATLTCLRTLVI